VAARSGQVDIAGRLMALLATVGLVRNVAREEVPPIEPG
jgi:hypothetical protein